MNSVLVGLKNLFGGDRFCVSLNTESAHSIYWGNWTHRESELAKVVACAVKAPVLRVHITPGVPDRNFWYQKFRGLNGVITFISTTDAWGINFDCGNAPDCMVVITTSRDWHVLNRDVQGAKIIVVDQHGYVQQEHHWKQVSESIKCWMNSWF